MADAVPFTVRVKINVKSKRAGVPAPHKQRQDQGQSRRIGVSIPYEQNPHFSQTTREMRHPAFDTITVKNNGALFRAVNFCGVA
jgi:hypothetical protein